MNKKERLKYMRELGARGGRSTKERYGVEHYKKLGKKGQDALMKALKKK